MKNWKTTLTGLISAIAVSLIPVIQGHGFELESIAIGVALGVLGFIAKDYDTTGVGYSAEKLKDI